MTSSPPSAHPNTLRFLAGCAAIVVGCIALKPGLFMVDDAWFYLQIARNIALGEGSTFDGVHFTNGYHPLWMAIASAIGTVTVGTRSAMLYGAFLVQGLLVTGGCIATYRLASDLRFPYPLAPVILWWLLQVTSQGWLSEGPVNAALHVAVLVLWMRNSTWRTGALLGFLFLARLDTVFFIGTVVLFTLPDGKRAVKMGLSAAGVALPWVVGTWMKTGHIVPVSGAIKSVFPYPDFTDLYGKLGLVGLVTLGGALVGGLLALSLRDARQRRLLGALSMGALLHGAYVALFTAPRWSTFVAYYWITGTFATGFTLCIALQRYLALLQSLSEERRAWMASAILAFFAFAGAGRAVRSVVEAPTDPTITLGTWYGETYPDGVLMTLDAPGRLAWFSGRPVIGTDGLTQDYDFAETVERRGLPSWARDQGVTHIMTYIVDYDLPWAKIDADAEVTVRFIAPGRGTPAGELRLSGSPIRGVANQPGEPDVAGLFNFE